MTFLVDANVLSESTKPAPDPAVVDWLRRNERALVVDPIVLGEIKFGILRLPRAGGGRGWSAGSTTVSIGCSACRGTPPRASVGPGSSPTFAHRARPCRSRTA